MIFEITSINRIKPYNTKVFSDMYGFSKHILC